MVHSRRSTSLPTKADWAQHRGLIARLYLTDKKTLPVVKDIMSTEHGFFASDKMYKTKFKQWNLDKNLNWQEIMDAMPLIAQSVAFGDQLPYVAIGSRRVPILSIYEYLRKRADGQEYLDIFKSQFSRRARLRDHQIRPPDDIYHTRRFLHYLTEWGICCYETKVWSGHGSDEELVFPSTSMTCCQTAKNLTSGLQCALMLERHGFQKESQLLLQKVLQYVPYLVDMKYWLIFSYLIFSMRVSIDNNRRDLALWIRHAFASGAKTSLTAGDPRIRLYQDLACIDLSLLRKVDLDADLCMLEVSRKYLGDTHAELKRYGWYDDVCSRELSFARWDNHQCSDVFQRVEPQINKTLACDPRSAAVRPRQTRPIQMALESSYMQLGRYEEAKAVAKWLIKHYEWNLYGLSDRVQSYWLKTNYDHLGEAAHWCDDQETEAYANIRRVHLHFKLTRNPFDRLLIITSTLMRLGQIGQWTEDLAEPLRTSQKKLLNRLIRDDELDYGYSPDDDSFWDPHGDEDMNPPLHEPAVRNEIDLCDGLIDDFAWMMADGDGSNLLSTSATED